MLADSARWLRRATGHFLFQSYPVHGPHTAHGAFDREASRRAPVLREGTVRGMAATGGVMLAAGLGAWLAWGVVGLGRGDAGAATA